MTRYTYKVLNKYNLILTSQLVQIMNEYGANGWELVFAKDNSLFFKKILTE